MTDDMLTPEGLQMAVWNRLEEGAQTRQGPGHVMAFATQKSKGPDLRYLVLRAASRADRMLRFWTNAKSDKIGHLQALPKASAALWDPAANLQARLSLNVTIHAGDRGTWEALPGAARVNYTQDPAPGHPLDAPEDAKAAKPHPDMFVWLDCRVTRMDILCLGGALHKRALITDDHARWIMP